MTLITTPFHAKSTAAEVLAGVDLSGRRIIVTGGTSGIGAATARALADAGAEVTATTRDQLDLSDLTSVREFVESWSGPVHAIVANAGIMAIPERRTTAGGWELQLATNFLGHFALITGLRDRLSPDARIVAVSSGAQKGAGVDFDDPHFERRPYDPWTAYAQSKSADVLLAVAITRKWAKDGITANALNPGYIHTRLQRHLTDEEMTAMGGMDDRGNLLTPDYYKTPEQGASTSALLAASPLVDGVSGRYFEDNQESGEGAAAWSLDPIAADRLWDLAAAATS